MKTALNCALGMVLTSLPMVAAEAVSASIPAGYQLLYQSDFQAEDAARQFVYTDPDAWTISEDEGEATLELAKQSEYQPEVRSPHNIALIADRQFGDFILEADLRQTGREYGHRDMCLFFGMQNPSQFYYVHMASVTDDAAHQIFIVNNEPRTKISLETTKGVQWGQTWHRVRLERRVSEGTIKVFFDDMDTPIMVAEDTSFGAGYIGFGSFDDTGRVKNVKIWGPEVETKPIEFYERKAD